MTTPPDFESKICPPDQIQQRLAGLNGSVVFTNGVFDLLHRGHVTYLAQARARGEHLILALNSDASARRLGKGPERPINGLPDRAAVVAALASTTLVTWFEDDTPLDLIRTIMPNVLVKGGDWPIEKIVGADLVLANGGQVRSIDFEHQRSTTRLVSKIRADSAQNPGQGS